MTDEELKEILLAKVGDDFGEPGYILVTPDGPAAWDRIEEIRRELNLAVCNADYLLDKATKQHNRIAELEALAQALIDDVRARYPSEELRCPHMIALDEALKGTDDDG